MFLVREDLILALEAGKLELSPFDPARPETLARIQPASIDLQVGESYATYRDEAGLAGRRLPRRLAEIDERLFDVRRLGRGEGVVLPPLGFMLVAVDVHLHVGPGLVVYVEGKSSVGRAGLAVQNAGFVEPGFTGVLTLELFNQSPIPLLLEGGDPIGQLAVARTTRPTEYLYGRPDLGSRYQHQHRVQPPRPQRPFVAA